MTGVVANYVGLCIDSDVADNKISTGVACSLMEGGGSVKFLNVSRYINSLCVNFKKPNTQPSVAVTRWVLEWSDNFILYNDFLEGREDLVWLAKRNMDDGKGKPYYPWGHYEFAEKTGGIFPKPKASSISPALSRVVRVTYQKLDKQRQGQRIFCQRPGDPRNIFGQFCLNLMQR